MCIPLMPPHHACPGFAMHAPLCLYTHPLSSCMPPFDTHDPECHGCPPHHTCPPFNKHAPLLHHACPPSPHLPLRKPMHTPRQPRMPPPATMHAPRECLHNFRETMQRIQDFPEEGAPTPRGGGNIRFCKIFPKTA